MKVLSTAFAFLTICFRCDARENSSFTGSQADRDSLARTSVLIRAAFSKGNVDDIIKFHHPDVIKALGYHNYQKGVAEVKSEIAGTLKN